MSFLEGVTTAGNGVNRRIDCNDCQHLDGDRLCQCPELVDEYGPRRRRRTVDFCLYFTPKEEEMKK